MLSRATSQWRVLEVNIGDLMFISTQIPAAVSAACGIRSDNMSFCIGVGDPDRWTINGHAVDSRSLAFFPEGAETVTRTSASPRPA